MQSIPISADFESRLRELLTRSIEIEPAVKQIADLSGIPYLVGGAVRDLLLQKPVHDLDIEVHHLTLDQVSDILSTQGPVSYVGKSFGVLKLHGSLVDWSLPRTDTSGRKPVVKLDPSMGIIEALKRRDLTINAMAINLITYELIDPFHGFDDLQKGILRSPDIIFFCEDPLRFYRVMSFIGRFGFYPDAQLQTLCKKMDISDVSVERIEYEFEKLLLKSKRPSLGIRWLVVINRLGDILPELVRTEQTQQNPRWHPEGNVFEHLMQTLDAATMLERGADFDNLILRYAALCHDLGKVDTTVLVKGVLKSPGHAEAGVPYAKSLLKRLTRNTRLIAAVASLVKYHMSPSQFISLGAKLAAFKRLALKLAPQTNLEMLAYLSLADRRGRNSQSSEPLKLTPQFFKKFLEKAERARSLREPEKPLLLGRDINDLVEPGPEMGHLLRYAYELQIESLIKNKEELRKKVIEKLSQQKI